MTYNAWALSQEIGYLISNTSKPTAETASDTTVTKTSGDGSTLSVSLSTSTKEYDRYGPAVMVAVGGGWVGAANEMVDGEDTGYGPDAISGNYRQQVDVSTMSLSALYTAAGQSADGESDTETASLLAQFIPQSSGSQGPVAWAEKPDGTIEFATFSSSFTPSGSKGATESPSGGDGSGSIVASTTSAFDPVSAKRTDERNLIDQLFQISDNQDNSGNKNNSGIA
ncbi:hypothetical protein AA13595_3123 [Gluconacetobacter johannae DSM 13595]|nr:hypothetical protein [Gluconacetobacter johannae]GBQ91421.1 hypothetical protein AA13595_3123 [Gluconacetobacter johannae DSM 13595]